MMNGCLFMCVQVVKLGGSLWKAGFAHVAAVASIILLSGYFEAIRENATAG